MHKITLRNKKINGLLLLLLILIFPILKITAQSVTTPQVDFSQRSSTATPEKKIYNIKGDFTLLGNTNLTLLSYGDKKNNEGNEMIYVDIDEESTTLNSSMATLELSNAGENDTNQSCSKVLFAGLYWTGKSDDTKEIFSVTKNSVTKTYNKNRVSLKGPGAINYTEITATTNSNTTAIRFPGVAQSGIFVGYQEVTDYVKLHGPGKYTVADIALKEGTNSNPGYSGGWVMIVIYENPAMKPRAVTLFDGYAYVNGQKTNGGEYGNIPISGFTTVGSGPVNMKLGVMAAEGDVGTASGRTDYLSVLKLNSDSNSYPGNYQILNHTGNLTGNFFNSSIFPKPVTGMSNPILNNNTGVDFSMFTMPNPGNSVIDNNQTSTNFRFGSNYDVYTIFGFAMSVDAYIPEPQGIIKINSIGGTASPSPLAASPGDDIEYQIDIRNRGSESTKNSIITIPIPFSTLYTIESIVTTIIDNSFLPTNAPVFDSNSNSIIWNIGNIPLANPNTLLASLVFKVKLTTDCATLFNAGCNSNISLTGTISGAGAVSNNPFTIPISQGIDPNSSCGGLIDKPILVNFNSSNSPCFASLAGADTSSSMCGLSSVVLNATAGTQGTWSIFNGPTGGGEVFSNKNSPTTEFSTPNAGIYTLRWTIPYGNGTCTPIFDDVQVSTALCNKLDFDGIDDNVNFGNNYNFDSGSFSIEVWVKPSVSNGNIQTIFSKRSSVALEDGYDLRIVNNILSFNWNKGNSITSKFPISTGRWYHIAVTFNGTAYNLFIDGIKVENAVSGYNPIANNNTKSILGAMIQNTSYPYLPTNFFNGWMQELRIWNVALTESQMHQMMNQKIKNNESSVLGLTVPQIILGINWGNLEGYYQMVQSSDIVNGHLIDKSTNSRDGKLTGITTAQPETAPLPYTTLTDNVWENNATWSHGDIWNIPNSLGVDVKTYIDWNIVKTNHNIISTGNKTVLGLLVENNTVTATNDTKIEVSHYLKLDGKIDLQGMSQLLQTTDSELDPTSKGSIERDQQGQSNKFNYNYWSSPVSKINSNANNQAFTLKELLHDGTDPANPKSINWIEGYDGSSTANQISLARYWVYKFDNLPSVYANWTRIGENGSLDVGKGFTLKGSGTSTSTQNYTFVGKPNNGTISNTVNHDQLLLTGNPYPSSLDANKFINDNISSIKNSDANPAIDGGLYFWEHYTSNNTHILRDYQGGYAIRNLSGGLPPSSVGIDFISGAGTTLRLAPKQFIPVGQGFFVIGKNVSSAAVTFNNSQRAFIKENDTPNSQVMYKVKPKNNNQKQTIYRDNSNDVVEKDTHKRIRLGFNYHTKTYHRQVLIAFMDEQANSEMNDGYDAYNIDNSPSDMYLLNGENELAIQGEGYFDKNASFPIGVRIETAGKVSFGVDALENFDTNQSVYIYDAETDIHHPINDALFEIELTEGIVNDRFSLRFTVKTLGIKNATFENAIAIHYTQSSKILTIANNMKDNTVETASLFDIQGKAIANWKVTDKEQTNIKIQVQSMTSGVYIVKLKTTKGNISKKIIVR
ncbi:T9SS type A sorting domain-containing protein [Flavobacterium galactosidilyticum]|uniref:LamG-like jellyroll fold domain-containing protein n=1 Tax=Flavobacterium galactosidilyticum TaxID=2893886 RepID=UPI001E2E38FA|nr:LamG-like jellyroll fold domain-containing protein [Flavobacterium sp. F-340]UFH46349.1 T9SS type A sorting domain-containing protein [Flavobacterium sp. F-340]